MPDDNARIAELERAVKDALIALRPFPASQWETADVWKTLYAQRQRTAREILNGVDRG